MADTTPFLSAGLPGLTFGLSLGRGMSIQLDPSGEIIQPEDETITDEDLCLLKNTEVPCAMVVVHIHALHNIVLNGMEGLDDVYLYVSFSVASIKKVTSKKLYNPKNDSIVVFNEVKYIPLIVNLKADEHMNKLIVKVFACCSGEEHAVTKCKHKLVGRFEAEIHKLLKEVVVKENANLFSKKGNIMGKCEMEFGILYGAFGYGQSHQLQNNTHTPAELVKMSLFPRIYPVTDTSFKGTAIFPRKLFHPTIVPLQHDAVEDLEPEISSIKTQEALECPIFPLLNQHLQRITNLRSGYSKQTTRSKRMYYLKKVLQDESELPSGEFEEVSDDESNERQSSIPPALALLMNATKFFHDAPGIVRRRKPSSSSDSSAQNRNMEASANDKGSSANYEPLSCDVEKMKDLMFAYRRKSVAPAPLME